MITALAILGGIMGGTWVGVRIYTGTFTLLPKSWQGGKRD